MASRGGAYPGANRWADLGAELASAPMRSDDHERLRAAKFAALADLFRTEPERATLSVFVLLQPCPGVATCPVAQAEIVHAGHAALDWTREANRSGGTPDPASPVLGPPAPCGARLDVPACAEVWLSDGNGEVEREVEEVYAELGFEPRQCDGFASHIVNELGFMSYLLVRASRGDAEAERAARDFLVSHLLTWAVVFSAAAYTRAEHPVMRFAGLMLEHLLFCQVEHSRRRESPTSSSALSA